MQVADRRAFDRLAAAVGVSACTGQPSGGTGTATPSRPLRFTAIPDQNSTELQEKFRSNLRFGGYSDAAIEALQAALDRIIGGGNLDLSPARQ